MQVRRIPTFGRAGTTPSTNPVYSSSVLDVITEQSVFSVHNHTVTSAQIACKKGNVCLKTDAQSSWSQAKQENSAV